MIDKEMEREVCEAKREYFKQWRANNKEKVKRNNENYWRKKALERIAKKQKATDGTTGVN